MVHWLHIIHWLQETSPDLYADLATASFVIFKGSSIPIQHALRLDSSLWVMIGDLNYRKLVGDREWPLQATFEQAVCGNIGPHDNSTS